MVAANLAERFWTVMNRGMPYVICDTNGHPVEPEHAKKIIAEHWTVPPEVRARRRSKKTPKTRTGKAPRQSQQDSRHGATFPTHDPQPNRRARSTNEPLDTPDPL